MTSDETRLNVALEAAGITPYETDLADLIIQLGARQAVAHRRAGAASQPRRDPRDLSADDGAGRARAGAGRPGGGRAALSAREVPAGQGRLQRREFRRRRTPAPICVVESEGNGRMCVTLPRDPRSRCVGIEKMIPSLADLEVFLQLLPRSATGERMNPYNSIWTGTRGADGPEEFHVVLLDNGRTDGARGRRGARDAALHPLRRLPERLPGLPPDRRPCVRLDLQRTDRRDSHAAAAVAGAFARRCRMRRRSAAPATKSVR